MQKNDVAKDRLSYRIPYKLIMNIEPYKRNNWRETVDNLKTSAMA